MLKFLFDLVLAYAIISIAGELSPLIEQSLPWLHKLIQTADTHLLDQNVILLALLIRFYRIDANADDASINSHTHVNPNIARRFPPPSPR